jgi:hypothetical protein
MAEKRSNHELAVTAITDFRHARALRPGCNYRGPPELVLRVMHHVGHSTHLDAFMFASQ